MKKVLVIIPCYNEEKSIASVIKDFPHDKLSHAYQIDILVVDNNSSDNTTAVAKAAGAHVIHAKEQGKGYAIRAGFNNIGDADYVVMLDGDDTYRPQEIGRMLEPLHSEFSKVVIGSRLGGRISTGSMRSLNRAGNWTYSHLVRSFYRVNVTDVLTGYFAWNSEIIRQLRPHLTSEGFAIEMEMITKMARLGNEIYSVPISYHARAGESSLNPITDGAKIMVMFLRNLFWKPSRELALLDRSTDTDSIHTLEQLSANQESS